MTKQKSENIKRATLLLIVTLFVSRLLGFIREMTVAGIYGRNITTDAFFAAFSIPDVMFNLLVGGALSSGFMPVFNSYIAKDDEDGAWDAASTFVTVAVIFILTFNVFGIIFAKYLVPLVAIGNTRNPQGFALTVSLTRVMFPAVTFTALAGLLRGILNSYNIFTSPAVGPVLYNIGFILGPIILGKRFGIYGMAIGVVAGAIANFLVQVPDFRRVGKKFRFRLNTKNSGYRKMIGLMIPSIIGLSISQVSVIVNQNVASVLGAGDITAIRYATRVMLLPLGIFTMSISTTIFPRLNAYVAKNEMESYKSTLSKGLRMVMFVTIPASAAMIVLNVPIVRLLFKTGKFTEQDVKVTALALAFYSVGLIGQSAVQIITRGFYSIQNTKTPLRVAVLVETMNIVMNILFVKFTKFGVAGIAFSYSFTSVVNMVMLYRNLSKNVNGLKTANTLSSSIKATIASVLAGIAALFMTMAINSRIGFASKGVQTINVVSTMAVAGIIYFVSTYYLKMPEVHYALEGVRRKLKKK